MIRKRGYCQVFQEALGNGNQVQPSRLPQPVTIIGHSRLVTNGSQEIHENNQPTITAGMVGINNGIVVNDKELWQRFPCLQRRHDNDTEVILSLIRMYFDESGSLVQAAQSAFAQIEGAASIAVLLEDADTLLLASNNGSLYTCCDRDTHTRVFASERHILRMLTRKRYLHAMFDEAAIQQIEHGSGCLIQLSDSRRSVQPQTKRAAIPANRATRGGAPHTRCSPRPRFHAGRSRPAGDNTLPDRQSHFPGL